MKVLIVEDQFIEAYDLQLMLERNGYIVTGIASSAADAMGLIEKSKPDLLCLDICIKGKESGIDLGMMLQGSGIGIIYVSANSSKSILDQAKVTNPYGFIVKPFREEDIISTLEIAAYRHKHSSKLYLEHKNLLEQHFETLVSNYTSWPDTLINLGAILQAAVPFDYLEIRSNHKTDVQGLLRKNFKDYKAICHNDFLTINPNGYAKLDPVVKPLFDRALICDGPGFTQACHTLASCRFNAETFGVRCFMVLPVITNKLTFEVYFYNRQPESYNQGHLALAESIKLWLLKLMELRGLNQKAFDTQALRKVAIDNKVKENSVFDGIIGNSKKMVAVYDAISRVAPSDTSVLILGENGTGKEQVARCIHNLSPRKDKPFIAINCAAIPANLAESILFGHEKGAFTGANERHIGKFELAEKGTIFLDEIGEMPIELQVKLLRVLQENEIERIGGQKTVKINVRIVAATNKNLEQEMSAGRFRIDLFYRLYVFPIMVPSLRERPEDITALANYFMNNYCKKLSKPAMVLSETATQQLMCYNWPGNVRQLEHAIQRSIIMADTTVISDVALPKAIQLEGQPLYQEFAIDSVKTIQEMERDYIYHILKKCKGKVYGNGGAAELLDLPPSTLNSKMKKLGISIRSI